MVKHFVTFKEPAKVYKQVQRNRDNDYHSSQTFHWKSMSKTKIDWNDVIAEFNLEDLNLDELTEKKALARQLEALMPDETGIFYIYIRNACVQPSAKPRKGKKKGKKKQRGRKLYSRKKLMALGIKGRPRQKVFVGFNCILKFQMVNGTINHIEERKGKRKRRPYGKPKYEIIRKLEQNKKLFKLAT